MESWAAWAQSPNLRPTWAWLGLTWVEELTELKGATGHREAGPSSDGRNGEGWMLVSWTEVDTLERAPVSRLSQSQRSSALIWRCRPITAPPCSHLCLQLNHLRQPRLD